MTKNLISSMKDRASTGFMAAAAAAALMALLTGCASTQPSIPLAELDSFVAKPASQRVLNQVKVRWEVRDDAAQACLKKMPQAGAQAVQAAPIACAVWHVPTQECVIITARQVAHVTLGHELRHCFEGHFH
jgi:cobalamin biosynthesis protein CbiD